MGWVGGRVPLRWNLLIACAVSVAAVAFLAADVIAGERPASQGTAVALALPLPSALPSPSLPPLPSPGLPTPSAPSLPLPLPSVAPISTPPIIASPLPSPSLPILASPTPSLPVTGGAPGSSPSPSPKAPAAGSGVNSGGSSSSGGPGGGLNPPGGFTVPLTTIVLHSPFDIALAGALAVLPLLGGLWLLLFGRTWTQARQAKDSRIRLMLAGELGIGPRELMSLSTKSLFKLREEAAFDDLTGVLRRAAGTAALEREIARARRQNTPLTVAFIDLDGLKEANDTRGHKAGDQLLRGIAKALTSGLRGQDLVLRYGGDEFVAVLPDTIYDAARAKLSWIQTDAAKEGIRFSVGFAELQRADDVVSLLGRADRELYEAKARRLESPAVKPPADQAGRRQVSA
jgi:diguanylate cyclase (GGDEF)-like protein